MRKKKILTSEFYLGIAGQLRPAAVFSIRSSAMLPMIPVVAAAGYSLIYLLLGGGLGGAALIFVVLKMLGK